MSTTISSTRMTKSHIRQSIRKLRNQYSAVDRAAAGQNIAKQLTNNLTLDHFKKTACFLSNDGEIPTQLIINQLLMKNSICYLPKLRPFKPNRLWFMPYNDQSTLLNNRYGIPEVNLLPNHALAVSKLNLVLLPLVAFDNRGNRLGMGGGYYDATFAHLKNSIKRPLFIGLAYEIQQVEYLPCDLWDLPLDAVCTESNFYRF